MSARNSLSEIIAAIKSCDPTVSTAEYQVLYDTMSTSSSDDFTRNSANYYNQLNSAYQKMQEICNTEPQALDG